MATEHSVRVPLKRPAPLAPGVLHGGRRGRWAAALLSGALHLGLLAWIASQHGHHALASPATPAVGSSDRVAIRLLPPQPRSEPPKAAPWSLSDPPPEAPGSASAPSASTPPAEGHVALEEPAQTAEKAHVDNSDLPSLDLTWPDVALEPGQDSLVRAWLEWTSDGALQVQTRSSPNLPDAFAAVVTAYWRAHAASPPLPWAKAVCARIRFNLDTNRVELESWRPSASADARAARRCLTG